MIFINSKSNTNNALIKEANNEGLRVALKLVPFGQMTSVGYAVAIIIVFKDIIYQRQILPWIIAIFAIALLWIGSAFTDSQKPELLGCKIILKHTILAALSAFCFSIVDILISPYTSGINSIFMGSFMIGMIAAGAFILATAQLPAISWIVFLGIGPICIIIQERDSLTIFFIILLILYYCFVISTVFYTSTLFTERFISKSDLEEQREINSLLLRDFEEKSGDWLWEIDDKFYLTYASPKLTEAVNKSYNNLIGLNFIDIIEDLYYNNQNDKDDIYLMILKSQFENIAPFKDINIEVCVNNKFFWWSLSANPLILKTGKNNGWRGVVRDITESKNYEKEIEWRANYDNITGLANQYQLRKFLNDIFKRVEDTDPLALVLIEINNFKTIKTFRGQSICDDVLKEIGKRLREFGEGWSFSARMEGDEFAIVLMNPPDSVTNVVNQLIEILHKPIVINYERVEIKIYAGVAYANKDASDTDNLLQCVGLAIAAAKEDKRKCIEVYNLKMAERSLRRISIINDLGKAIEAGEFELFYQPQINVATGKIVGVEALIRWKHRIKGMFFPDEFIPLAEQTGKIIDIDRWALKQACSDAMKWILPWKVSVNLSAEQFKRVEIINEIQEALESSGLKPQRLILEITESAFIDHNNTIKEILQRIRHMGVEVAIDDFGTGYSSLKYLLNFPLDELKIDRSFVRSIGVDRESKAIISMIISLAKTLELTIVAEGVELNEQAEFLKEHGCDRIQGYLYGKPINNAELIKKMEVQLI